MIVIDLSFMIVIDCWIILCSVIIPKYMNKRRKGNRYEKNSELTRRRSVFDEWINIKRGRIIRITGFDFD